MKNAVIMMIMFAAAMMAETLSSDSSNPLYVKEIRTRYIRTGPQNSIIVAFEDRSGRTYNFGNSGSIQQGNWVSIPSGDNLVNAQLLSAYQSRSPLQIIVIDDGYHPNIQELRFLDNR